MFSLENVMVLKIKLKTVTSLKFIFEAEETELKCFCCWCWCFSSKELPCCLNIISSVVQLLPTGLKSYSSYSFMFAFLLLFSKYLLNVTLPGTPLDADGQV